MYFNNYLRIGERHRLQRVKYYRLSCNRINTFSRSPKQCSIKRPRKLPPLEHVNKSLPSMDEILKENYEIANPLLSEDEDSVEDAELLSPKFK